MGDFNKIVNLCKSRGLVFPGSDIYDGLANTWDYGPVGVELKNNIKRAWWKKFVQESHNSFGIDADIFMNSRVWEASGHTASFSDPKMDCKSCKTRHRADNLIEAHSKGTVNPDLMSNEEMEKYSDEFPRPTGEEATKWNDTMLVYFTSGTTGMPKSVMHNFAHPFGHIITAKYWQQVQENKLHMSVSDSGWAKFGWGKIYGQWLCGAVIFAYDMDKFIPKNLLQKMQDYKLTTFCAPPTMYRFMLQEDVASYDLSSIQNFATAGEPLNAEVFNKWKKVTNGGIIREGFGQTEGNVLLATFPWVEPKPGALGKPSPLYDIKLLKENGEIAGPNEEGAIIVDNIDKFYPAGLFVGYYKNPEMTKEVLGGKFYNLHDMAYADEEGYYHFVGRNDDVIKCSGYRIGPFEVESAVLEHPACVECAITAAPDPIRGQVVKATIVLAKGYEPSPELIKEIQNHVKHTTAPYKYPRIVEFVDELPKTLGGKIKRAEIRKDNYSK